MSPEELRIGNYIMITESSQPKQISYLMENFEISCLPIRINEEWLLNFGFEKTIESFDLIYKKGKFIINLDFIMYDIDMIVKLNYVHQLQNLYFVLTGEELKLRDNAQSKA